MTDYDVNPKEPWHKDDWERLYGQRRDSSLSERSGNTRMFVTLTFDTQGDVDAGVRGATGLWKSGHINYADLTQRQYDMTAGVDRILALLDRYGVPATFPTCGLTAQWYPDVVKRIHAAGHELAVHGHTHELLHTLTDEQIADEIETATAAVGEAIGGQPSGWVSPVFSITPFAFRRILDAGYSWNSDFHNDDVPYHLDLGDKSIVELPVGANDWDLYLLNDLLGARMGGVPYASPVQVTDILTAQFDQLYEESSTESPRVFHYCMHPKITGRPYRTRGLRDVIEHIQQYDGVEFVRCRDLAGMCR